MNVLEYWETKKDGRKQHFITLTQENVYQTMRAGRSRWKIENETFNTLKNQGYNFLILTILQSSDAHYYICQIVLAEHAMDHLL